MPSYIAYEYCLPILLPILPTYTVLSTAVLPAACLLPHAACYLYLPDIYIYSLMYTIPHTSLPTTQHTYSFSSSLFYRLAEYLMLQYQRMLPTASYEYQSTTLPHTRTS